MATTNTWQRASESVEPLSSTRGATLHTRPSSGTYKWIVLDILSVLVAVAISTSIQASVGPKLGSKEFWRGDLLQGRPLTTLLILLCGFTISLIFTSRRLHLYTPERLGGYLHEQRLSFQACFTSGLLLTGAIYLLHAADIPRSIVIITLAVVTTLLNTRRLALRMVRNRQLELNHNTRNVLIVGSGPEAEAVRHHVESIRSLGYTCKGFVEIPTSVYSSPTELANKLDRVFEQARMQFVDEIFLAAPHERGVVQEFLAEARRHRVDLRVIPELYDGLAWSRPVEYIGQFPTFPLHTGEMPELALMLKRALDIVLSCFGLVCVAIPMLVIAILVKLDSRGPIFYRSERIGRKGRVFKCTKFRTMVADAEKRKAELMHKNERDGVLFKLTNDPRITRVGRVLRKYSLDELPQLFDVIRGDMSLVGPRPPIASEVRQYKPTHLRRLDVTPGITGLWQVQARQDPSFDSYISLDVSYIENWSIWLDIKILMRTIGVVFAGTGS